MSLSAFALEREGERPNQAYERKRYASEMCFYGSKARKENDKVQRASERDREE